MSDQNTVPQMLVRIADLQRDVAELMRRRLPALPTTPIVGSGFPVGPYTDGVGVTYEISAGASPASPGVMFSTVFAASGTAAVAYEGFILGGGSGSVNVGGIGTDGFARMAATNSTGDSAVIQLASGGGGATSISLDAATVSIASFASQIIAFFGVPGSTQVATPATLADVIALLQAYGLSA